MMYLGRVRFATLIHDVSVRAPLAPVTVLYITMAAEPDDQVAASQELIHTCLIRLLSRSIWAIGMLGPPGHHLLTQR